MLSLTGVFAFLCGHKNHVVCIMYIQHAHNRMGLPGFHKNAYARAEVVSDTLYKYLCGLHIARRLSNLP